jgi:23S rRNA (adenine1618-N6)-methyltransferase
LGAIAAAGRRASRREVSNSNRRARSRPPGSNPGSRSRRTSYRGFTSTIEAHREVRARARRRRATDARDATRARGAATASTTHARGGDDRRRARMSGRSRKRARARDARDFAALARKDARLGARVEWRVDARGEETAVVDFKDWDSTRALTGAILREEYGVEAWTVPRGRLVPTATNRERYLEWLARLRALSAPSGDDASVWVLDIGTGASAIYALLGAAGRGWRFVGTDVCDEALTSARENVRRNPHLESLIEIRDARGEDGARDRVLRGVVRDGETFTFCMCNPPFFETMDEAGRNPNTACGGTATEMVFPGGEEAFVKKIFADSLTMKDSIHWFTTMCGKKSTMTKTRSFLHTHRVPAIRTTELSHGKTSRWCIAWSFSKDAASKALVPLPEDPDGKKAAVSGR